MSELAWTQEIHCCDQQRPAAVLKVAQCKRVHGEHSPPIDEIRRRMAEDEDMSRIAQMEKFLRCIENNFQKRTVVADADMCRIALAQRDELIFFPPPPPQPPFFPPQPRPLLF